jgi:hypothetical protein
VYVKVDADRVKMLTVHPEYTLEKIMFEIDVDIKKYIVIFNDKIMPINTNVVVFFHKTRPSNCLKVLYKISELDDSYK